MNLSGPVERRQEEKHAILYATLQALKSVPENSFKKVCICVRDPNVIRFVARDLPRLSENSYRSARSGRLIKDLETAMEINQIIRTRSDITFRMKFVPINVLYPEARFSRHWACDLAYDLFQKKQRDASKTPDLLDLDY